MNVFSKFFSIKYTGFLFILVVFCVFNNDCSARESPQKGTESEVNVLFSNDGKIKNSEKSSQIPSQGKNVNTEAAPQKMGNVELGQSSDKEIIKSHSSKEVELKTSSSIQKQNHAKTGETSSDNTAISEFIKSFSTVGIYDIKKPFKDYPGYWNKIDDFNVTDIKVIEAKVKDEFPSKEFSLTDLKGQVVILFFTTTWCPNCVKVFQDLDKLSLKLRDKKLTNVKIITLVLGMDDDDSVKEYYKVNKIESLCKFRSVSPLFFNMIYAVPTCFVFNKKSTPIWGFSGIANYGSLDFLNFIEDLSKEDLK